MKKYTEFYLGTWLVLPMQNQLKNAEKEITLEPKLIDVLLYLCIHAPSVVSSEQIIEQCWPHQFLSDNPVHKSIAQLRKALGDTARNSCFIKTIPKKGYSIIAEIKGLRTRQKKLWSGGGSPYPGLHYYHEHYANVYFGRSKASSELKYLMNQLHTGNSLCVLLMGASGVGKTSLVKTVMLPYLKNPMYPFKVDIADIFEYEIPIQKSHSFIQSFIQFLQGKKILEPVFDRAKQIELIRNNPSDIFELLNKKYSINVVNLIFIDQLERIFVEKNHSQNEITLFFDLLQELLKTKQILIIISLKHEYYADVMKYKGFELIKKQSIQYDLLSPTLAEITEIINLPVAATGLTYEFDANIYESLNNLIISDAQNIGNVLPILSHTLNELCAEKNENNELTFDSYHKMGGLIGSITNKADEIEKIFSKAEVQSFRGNLHYLIQSAPDKTNKLFCAKAEIQHFQGTPSQHIMTYLIDAHLLHTEMIDDKSFVSILHESILEESKFFKSWINDNQLDLSIINEVKTLSSQWCKNNNKAAYLLKNYVLLQKSSQLCLRNYNNFETNERDYIQASLKKLSQKKWIKTLAITLLVALLFISSILLLQYQRLNSQLNTAHQEAENLLSYLLGELNNKLRPIGKLDLLGGIGAQVLNYYASVNHPKDSDVSLLHRIEALNTLGEVAVKKGHMSQAEQYFITATKQYESSTKELLEHSNLMFKISQTHYWLGYIDYVNSQAQLAENHWLDYLKVTQSMTELEPDKNLWQLELSYALNNLGTLYYQNEKYKKAEVKFDQSAQIKKTLVNRDPKNSQFIAELADTLSWQASIYEKNNQLIDSLSMENKALNLAKKLINIEPDNSIWKQRLGQAYYRLGLINYDLGNLNTVNDLLHQSLPLFVQLHHNDKSNQQWLKEMVNNYVLLAKTNRHQSHLDDAIVNINEAGSHFFMYSQETLNMKEITIQKYDFLLVKSQIFLSMDKPKAAASEFKKITGILEKLTDHEVTKKWFFMGYSAYIRAQIESANGFKGLANSTLTQAGEYSRKMIEYNPRSKEYMALNFAINYKLHNNYIDQKTINYMNKINYNNPDYLTQ